MIEKPGDFYWHEDHVPPPFETRIQNALAEARGSNKRVFRRTLLAIAAVACVAAVISAARAECIGSPGMGGYGCEGSQGSEPKTSAAVASCTLPTIAPPLDECSQHQAIIKIRADCELQVDPRVTGPARERSVSICLGVHSVRARVAKRVEIR